MGKNVLIIGIKNEESTCFAIAKALKKRGYEIYATYLNQEAKEDMERVAEELNFKKIYQYDARKDEDLASFTAQMIKDGVKLDGLVHGIAYSAAKGAKLGSYLMDMEWEDFADAIRVGAFSLIEVVGKLFDQLNTGASILALTSRLSKVAVPGFNVVGAAKASLDSIVRGLAEDLGRLKKIRVNALSAGAMATGAFGKLGNTLTLLELAKNRSPLKVNVKKDDVGSLAATLLENTSITGTIYPIDAGYDIMGV